VSFVDLPSAINCNTRRSGVLRPIRFGAVGLHQPTRYARTQVELSSRGLLNGMNQVVLDELTLFGRRNGSAWGLPPAVEEWNAGENN
jgi:hypothetical protein